MENVQEVKKTNKTWKYTLSLLKQIYYYNYNLTYNMINK